MPGQGLLSLVQKRLHLSERFNQDPRKFRVLTELQGDGRLSCPVWGLGSPGKMRMIPHGHKMFGGQVLASFLRPHLLPSNMSQQNVLQGAQNVVITDSNIHVADSVSEALRCPLSQTNQSTDQLLRYGWQQNDICCSDSRKTKLEYSVHRTDRRSRKTQGTFYCRKQR